MSDISAKLLKTTHKGVHEQFDMLAATMQVHVIANSDSFNAKLDAMSQKEEEKWIREMLAQAMTALGHKPGFLMKRLLVYVYHQYESFYVDYTSVLKFKPETPMSEIQYTILMLAASFLDNQFNIERLADVCAFLKQDVRRAIPALK